jgi:hypothetical protein
MAASLSTGSALLALDEHDALFGYPTALQGPRRDHRAILETTVLLLHGCPDRASERRPGPGLTALRAVLTEISAESRTRSSIRPCRRSSATFADDDCRCAADVDRLQLSRGLLAEPLVGRLAVEAAVGAVVLPLLQLVAEELGVDEGAVE